MNKPDFDRRAAEALGAARFHIDKLAGAAHPGENESVASRDNDPNRWDAARFDRMIDVCGTAHMATENAIKAFTAGVAHQLPQREHRIAKLLDQLPDLASQEFQGLLSPLTPEALNRLFAFEVGPTGRGIRAVLYAGKSDWDLLDTLIPS